MTKSKEETCYSSMDPCKVESVVSIDDRGQIVIPKDIRKKANIHAGDKLAIITIENEGKVCCLSIIKVEEINRKIKSILGPVMKEIL